MDERVKGEYRKIYSELTSLIMVFTSVSLLGQMFFLDRGPESCVTELVILIGSPLYLTARQYMMGLDPEAGMDPGWRRKRTLAVLLGGVLGFLLVAFTEGDRALAEYIICFILAFLGVRVLALKLGKFFAEKKSRQYED